MIQLENSIMEFPTVSLMTVPKKIGCFKTPLRLMQSLTTEANWAQVYTAKTTKPWDNILRILMV